ncbi:MAG TPA: septum site-determining protein MinC [Gammaproteobacteria bacterium]|nr:septum site-determining protein MinC [Gammaproteobacteria bacterium]
MSKSAEAKEQAALEIRFGPVDLAQVRLRTTDPGAILDDLTGRVATAPRFFERAAVCLDLSQLPEEPEAEECRAAIAAVRRAGMLPVALVQDAAHAELLARTLELPVVPPVRARSPAPAAPQPARPAPPAEDRRALMHHQHVRSGQRLFARDRDLIVTANVAAGAEIMADGCVHVYGSLRGRAIAGVHGDTAARVFCQEFRAELVSIAGVFRVFETLPAELAGHPVQAWLDGEDLKFARIGA